MWKAIAQFILAVGIYYTLSFLGMRKVVQLECAQDYFKMPYMAWMATAANIIPAVSIIYRLYIGKQLNIYFKRGACLYFLKGVVQFVTIVPAVSGTDECIDRNFIDMVLYGSCADMMFSGHTGITFIMAPSKEKYIFVVSVAIFLIFGEMHYASDVIIAVIVASWIEFVIPITKKIDTKKIDTKKIDTKKLTDITPPKLLLL